MLALSILEEDCSLRSTTHIVNFSESSGSKLILLPFFADLVLIGPRPTQERGAMLSTNLDFPSFQADVRSQMWTSSRKEGLMARVFYIVSGITHES